jgi:hypothetical protein
MIGQCSQAGARHPVHVILDCDLRVQAPQEIIRHPRRYALPFISILKRQRVKWHSAHINLSLLDCLKQFRSALG